MWVCPHAAHHGIVGNSCLYQFFCPQKGQQWTCKICFATMAIATQIQFWGVNDFKPKPCADIDGSPCSLWNIQKNIHTKYQMICWAVVQTIEKSIFKEINLIRFCLKIWHPQIHYHHIHHVSSLQLPFGANIFSRNPGGLADPEPPKKCSTIPQS